MGQKPSLFPDSTCLTSQENAYMPESVFTAWTELQSLADGFDRQYF